MIRPMCPVWPGCTFGRGRLTAISFRPIDVDRRRSSTSSRRAFPGTPSTDLTSWSGSAWPCAYSITPCESRRLGEKVCHPIFDGPHFSSLRDGKRGDMLGNKRHSHAGQHQAGEHGDGQCVVLNPLSSHRVCSPEHYVLHLIVESPARSKGVRGRLGGEVVEVGLEQPECLGEGVSGRARDDDDDRTVHTSKAPLTDSSHKSTMNSSSAMDSLSMEMSRWHNCGRKNSISS